MKFNLFTILTSLSLTFFMYSFSSTADQSGTAYNGDPSKTDRAALAKNTEGTGFGPQSLRDLNSKKGVNERKFNKAPHSRK